MYTIYRIDYKFTKLYWTNQGCKMMLSLVLYNPTLYKYQNLGFQISPNVSNYKMLSSYIVTYS